MEREVNAIPVHKKHNPGNFIAQIISNIGPGMYNWDIGFEAAKKKNESLMYTILQKLQQSKAPFNSQVDRFNFPVQKSATCLLGPGAYFNPDDASWGTKKTINQTKNSPNGINKILDYRSKSVMRAYPYNNSILGSESNRS